MGLHESLIAVNYDQLHEIVTQLIQKRFSDTVDTQPDTNSPNLLGDGSLAIVTAFNEQSRTGLLAEKFTLEQRKFLFTGAFLVLQALAEYADLEQLHEQFPDAPQLDS